MSRQNLEQNSQSASLARPRGGAASKEQLGELIDELILVPEYGFNVGAAAAQNQGQVKRRHQTQDKSKVQANSKATSKGQRQQVDKQRPALLANSQRSLSGGPQQLDLLKDWPEDLVLDTASSTDQQLKQHHKSRKSRFYGSFFDCGMPFLLDMTSNQFSKASQAAQEEQPDGSQLALSNLPMPDLPIAVPVIKTVDLTAADLEGQSEIDWGVSFATEGPVQELSHTQAQAQVQAGIQAKMSMERAMSLDNVDQLDNRNPFALCAKSAQGSLVGEDLVDNESLSHDGLWYAVANKKTALTTLEEHALLANKSADTESQQPKPPRKKRSSAKAQALEAMPMLLDFDDEEFNDSDKILKPQSQSAYQKQQAEKMAQAKFLAELQAAQDADKEVYNPLQYCNQLFGDDAFDDTKADAALAENAAGSGTLAEGSCKASLSEDSKEYPRPIQNNIKLIRELFFKFTERRLYTKMPTPVFGLTLMVMLVALDAEGNCLVGKTDLRYETQLRAWQQWLIDEHTLQLKLLGEVPAGHATSLVPAPEAMPELVPAEAEPKQSQELTHSSFTQSESKTVQQQDQHYLDLDADLELLSTNRITSDLALAFKYAQNALQELKFTLQLGQAMSFLSVQETSSPEHVLSESINFKQDHDSAILEHHAQAAVIGANIAKQVNLDNNVSDLAEAQEIMLADRKDLLCWAKRSAQHKGGDCKMDLENLLKMQIAVSILEDLSRDDFVELLSEMFIANGYTTLVCERNDSILPEIDLLLSSGKLGFGGTKICVKLSYNTMPLSRMVLDEFNGLVKKYQAEYGILISPSGFKKSFPPELCREFFKLQCWDMQRVVTEILACYPKLSSTAQKLLPLQQIWIVSD